MPEKQRKTTGGKPAQSAHTEVAEQEKIQTTAPKQFHPDNLCNLAGALATELDPSRSSIQVTLDSQLERDLGLDSLARVELLTRIDRAYGTPLNEEVLTSAETLRDLARAITRKTATHSGPGLQDDFQIVATGKQPGEVTTATTLVEMLHQQAERAPDQVHLYFYPSEEGPIPLTYKELLDQATGVACRLQELNIQPGSHVALMLPTGLEYFRSFFAILLAGAVPVPLYPPARPSQIEDHLRRHRHILDNCQAGMLITVAEAKPLARLLKSQLTTLRQVVTVEDLQGIGKETACTLPHPQPEETAFLQYTSGSTGIPKGVILTHDNLLTNIKTMGKVTQANQDDVFVSWLPLYHDMGLIGAWLGSLYHGCPLVIMSPLSFLVRPERWLWLIHRHKGTLAASPNFGYELCLSRIDDARIEGLDLRSWRMAFNGAEPVSPKTIKRFTERFSRYGLRSSSMSPVYGLAESSVGLAFPPQERGPLIDLVERSTFMKAGKAVQAEPGDSNPLEFVSCGQVLPDHQVRVVDSNDRELPDREVGHLQFQGPSATSGYYRNPDKTKELFHGNWLDTGDLAYISGQDIYLTSRVKDIIIRGGRNISPYELEEALGNLEGIRKGCVAVFGVTDQATATERMVILAESRKKDPECRARLQEQIINRTVDILGMPPDEVVLARPGTVLKTSSGKIRRAASRELYEQGKIHQPPRALWVQVVRLGLQSFYHQCRKSLRSTAATGYALYCWLSFALVATLTIPIALIVPKGPPCWRLARKAAVFLNKITNTKVTVQGVEHLSEKRRQILVVNHQSYLDSLILTAALPVQISYVAKVELTKSRPLAFFLDKLDVVFVERFDSKKALEDAQHLSQLVAQGKTLCVFAEGTLKRIPGLLPFHMGAFQMAAVNSVEVVPMIIRGTRAKLRDGTWFPRPGNVLLHIGPPIQAKGDDWDAALALRNQCRQYILHHCGEPDLGQKEY